MHLCTRAAMNLIKFIWTCILAGTCVAGIVTGCGPDAQNYIHDPYIVSPERVQYGSDVNLTCYILIEVKFVKFVSFTWKKNGERLIHGGDYEISSGSGSFVNSRYKYYTNTLTVKGTRRTAEGKRYMCQVEVAVGSRSSLFKTDEYIFGQKVPSTTTTTASEGQDVAIIPTWKLTDDVMRFWSPRGGVIATIHSISVYIWPNSRSKVKVSRMITSSYRKTVKLVICNATKEDAGRYYFRGFKRRVTDGTFNLVIAADRKSTTVTTSTEPSTEGQPEPETTAPASTTSTRTQVDVTSNTATVTSMHTSAATTPGTTPSTPKIVDSDHDVTTVALHITIGCCVLLIALAVSLVAVIVLIRIKQQGVHQRRTPATSTTANIIQRQHYDVVHFSPVGGIDTGQQYVANSSGYHTLNFKRFNRLQVDHADVSTTRNRLGPLDRDYEPVTLIDQGRQQYSDHEDENNDSVFMCSLYDHGPREKDPSGYAQCIVVAGNTPTISFE